MYSCSHKVTFTEFKKISLFFSYRIDIITQHTMKKNNIHQGPHKFQHLAKQAGTPLKAVFEPYLLHLHKMILTHK